jgi:hypothetical protein
MKLVERLHKARFDWNVRALQGTAPLRPGPEPFIALSMVHHRDVLPYLLALKSFARHAKPARVVLVADPSITAEDRELLQRHVPHLELRNATEFRREGIPVGGCWERLSAISHYAAESFVVQLDADTVALAELAAVRQAVRAGRSFTLGTEDVQPVLSSAQAAAEACKTLDDSAHVQLLAEAALDRFDTQGQFRYARGCAGFAGFARGSISPERVLDVSRRMAALLGDRWSSWGTEQFASNLLVCSSEGGQLLPHPDYCAPTRITSATVFLHFIGFVRFRTGLYAELARRCADELALASV